MSQTDKNKKSKSTKKSVKTTAETGLVTPDTEPIPTLAELMALYPYSPLRPAPTVPNMGGGGSSSSSGGGRVDNTMQGVGSKFLNTVYGVYRMPSLNRDIVAARTQPAYSGVPK